MHNIAKCLLFHMHFDCRLPHTHFCLTVITKQREVGSNECAKFRNIGGYQAKVWPTNSGIKSAEVL